MPDVPGVINFPTALDTAVSLIQASNNAIATLTSNISVSDLLIPVDQPGKFTDSGIATLTDSLTAPTKIEIFVYTSKSGSNLVVPSGGRGAQGTTAQAFSTGNFATQRPTARHHTALADLLIAIEQKLGIGADTPGAAVEALFSNGAGASLWRAIAQGDISGLVAALADKLSKSDAAQQTLIGNLLLSKESPLITLTDTVGAGGTGIININEQFLNISRSGQSDLLLALASGVFTFGQIPLLPGSDPTLANQAVRKQTLDDTRTAWSMAFIAEDPNVLSNNVRFAGWVVPDGTEIKVTKTKIFYLNGSHTSGGSVSFNIQHRTAASNWESGSDLGAITLDNTNNAVGDVYTNDVSDVTLSPNDTLAPFRSALSGTVSERTVIVALTGTQKRIA